MDDRDLVAAIVAGDAAGIAYAYDKYASPLYRYCHWMAEDTAEAAEAVQDTFVIAAARLGGLRDGRRLRPWLYAVARRECHRRWFGDLADDDDEVVELNRRHHLAGADLAAVLGVSRKRAHALAARARNQLAEAEPAEAAPLAVLPRTLRGEVLGLCTGRTPEALDRRDQVARRAGRFGPDGFPRPFRPTRRHHLAGTGTAAAAAAGVVIAVVSAGIVTALTLTGPHAPRPLAGAPAGAPAAPGAAAARGVTSGAATATSPASPGATATDSAVPLPGPPTGPEPRGPRPSPGGGFPTAPRPRPSDAGTPTPSAAPTPTQAASPTPAPVPSPTTSRGLPWPPPSPPPSDLP